MMKDIYTEPKAVKEVLMERQADPELCRKIGEYIGWSLPLNETAKPNPRAILARYVPRATEEDRVFANYAQELGLEPMWASYKTDRFTVRNAEKVATIRPPIQWSKGQFTKQWIVAEPNRDGGIGELETIYGGTSMEYQNKMRELIFEKDGQPELVANTFDMSEWYKTQACRFGYQEGSLAKYYYKAAMAYYALYGVLFEDFDDGPSAGNGDLARFNTEVVYPAFTEVESQLGVRPLIVQMPYKKGMEISDLSFTTKEAAEAEFVGKEGNND